LGTEATVAEHFVHIAEEAPINPSLVLNLAGCGLRCRFCQQGALLEPSRVTGERLEPELWARLQAKGARSLSFVGGNPDESLYAILRFLAAASLNWRLPIAWNCHAYGTLETMSLLEGVVDAYVPDFKYGNEACARRLSAVSHYPATARAAITAMLAQGVSVIVRILVLPGHFACCHVPMLDFLATLDRERLWVSVRGQYCPDSKIAREDGALVRRTSREETEAVRDKARSLGLTLID
jgi:putative pyruvate formate lyase activating enzyme